MAKIKNAVYKYAEEGNAPQIAAARAAAAARFAHADFGVASVGMGTGAEVVYLAVAHRGYVYIKRIKNGEGAGKVVALSALDMVRRLAQKQPVDRARMFKANSDFDWNAPLKKRRSSKYAAPIAVLAVLLVALAVACWYFFTHFSLGGGNGAGGALPVSGSTSVSAGASTREPASAPGTVARARRMRAELPPLPRAAETRVWCIPSADGKKALAARLKGGWRGRENRHGR